MPSSDRELFEFLTKDQETIPANDFLTYAIFANEKREWIKLYTSRNNRDPDQSEIDNWISNLTEYRISQMRDEAARFFDQAARLYLKQEFDREKDLVLKSAIIKEVKSAGSFWKQIAIALITAILAPIIIGGIIAGALTYDKRFPTAGAVIDTINPSETNKK